NKFTNSFAAASGCGNGPNAKQRRDQISVTKTCTCHANHQTTPVGGDGAKSLERYVRAVDHRGQSAVSGHSSEVASLWLVLLCRQGKLREKYHATWLIFLPQRIQNDSHT